MKIVNFISFFPTSSCGSFFILFFTTSDYAVFLLMSSNCVIKGVCHNKLEAEKKNTLPENQAENPRNQTGNQEIKLEICNLVRYFDGVGPKDSITIAMASAKDIFIQTLPTRLLGIRACTSSIDYL